jgi:hypothetical protein
MYRASSWKVKFSTLRKSNRIKQILILTLYRLRAINNMKFQFHNKMMMGSVAPRASQNAKQEMVKTRSSSNRARGDFPKDIIHKLLQAKCGLIKSSFRPVVSFAIIEHQLQITPKMTCGLVHATFYTPSD